MSRMMISLHLPKTAGRSFGLSLRSHFGESLKTDYKDMPIHRNPFRRHLRASILSWWNRLRPLHGIQCIHGHFLPWKYHAFLHRSDVDFVTWLRDPLQRTISHYHYWKRETAQQDKHPLQAKMNREGWTLERFCLGPEMRNFYTQFLWKFPADRFNFVGITEQYGADFAWFARHYLGKELPVIEDNVNKQRDGSGYDIPPSLRESMEEHHREDVLLYRGFVGKSRHREPPAPSSPS